MHQSQLLCFYSWSLADNCSKIIALWAAIEELGQMAADADGCSQAEENIFKRVLWECKLFLNSRQSCLTIFFYYMMFYLIAGVWSDLSVLSCHPKSRAEEWYEFKSLSKAFSQIHSHGSQHRTAAPKRCCLSSVVREPYQCFAAGAAPAGVRGHGYLCCRGTVTIVGCISGILLFIKTKHCGPT